MLGFGPLNTRAKILLFALTVILLSARTLAQNGTPSIGDLERQLQAKEANQGFSAGQANERAARAFLQSNAHRPGVVTTSSGLQYRILRNGSGRAPALTDSVTVNYSGMLLDGSEFDSSYKRGKPLTFKIEDVIKGWQEALQLMTPGSQFELFIPPDLAFGQKAMGPIPPGSLLRFSVELISVTTPN
jgi:FKBP-type peptidyl-prolyl cis-trans isomerase